MATQGLVVESRQSPGQQVPERTAWFLPGLRMLILGLAVVVAGVTLIWRAGSFSGDAATALIWLGVLILVAGAIVLRGLTAVVPGQIGRAHV